MKKIILLSITVFLLFSCNNSVLEKPKNLIDEDVMIEMLYDLSVLEAMKSTHVSNYESLPTNKELLKKKYKTDSITFAKSSQYYASDIRKYKKMYEKVKERLTAESTKLNKGKPVNSGTDVGVVK
jgi:hypothetical protein